jgi:hypothetical protein
MKEKDKKFMVERKIVRSTTFAAAMRFAFFSAHSPRSEWPKATLKLSINFRI